MITKDQAVAATYRSEFYHVSLRNRDGTALRCRVNGKCQTWKTRPAEFRLPVKHGLKECFYITQDTAADWLDYDPTQLDKMDKDLISHTVRRVWGMISADVDWPVDAEDAAELCLDADRPVTLGVVSSGQYRRIIDLDQRQVTLTAAAALRPLL